MAAEGEIFRCTVDYSAPNASAIQNVFWWVYHGTPTANLNVLNAIDSFITLNWGPDWQDFASQDFTLVQGHVQRVNPNGTIAGELGVFTPNLIGGVAEDLLTGVVAGYAQAFTSTPGHFGRKYIPGPGDSVVVDGLLNPETLADLAVLLVDWLEVLSVGVTGSLAPGLLSRTLLLFLEFNATGSITDVPAYQRRRKPNVGS